MKQIQGNTGGFSILLAFTDVTMNCTSTNHEMVKHKVDNLQSNSCFIIDTKWTQVTQFDHKSLADRRKFKP